MIFVFAANLVVFFGAASLEIMVSYQRIALSGIGKRLSS